MVKHPQKEKQSNWLLRKCPGQAQRFLTLILCGSLSNPSVGRGLFEVPILIQCGPGTYNISLRVFLPPEELFPIVYPLSCPSSFLTLEYSENVWEGGKRRPPGPFLRRTIYGSKGLRDATRRSTLKMPYSPSVKSAYTKHPTCHQTALLSISHQPSLKTLFRAMLPAPFKIEQGETTTYCIIYSKHLLLIFRYPYPSPKKPTGSNHARFE